ncbi:hypothetical protein CTAYLR_009704 [Chrysophaeum taylorii]|uniref:Cilia- and flagella-associated protein 300 n=1 Tax=Chrysophaeum taylorii TaxID=2483200 RepID=A0AAD7U6Y0_9STRA|nr:hypothetical protein CTAYLR_009704 [Chrysophaeum taylorii]
MIQVDLGLESLRDNREVRDNLERWGLSTLRFAKFRFEESLDADDAACVRRLLASDAVTQWLGEPPNGEIIPLRTTATSLDLFDPLEAAFATGSGALRPCAERKFDGLVVHDHLRFRLVRLELERNADGSKSDDLLDDDLEDGVDDPGLPPSFEEARSEFLFHIFSLLAIGGAMCQPDDHLGPYLQTAKALYRDLVTVFRSATTKAVTISTKAFRVYGPFASNNRLQRCYVLFERRARTAVILHHPITQFW